MSQGPLSLEPAVALATHTFVSGTSHIRSKDKIPFNSNSTSIKTDLHIYPYLNSISTCYSVSEEKFNGAPRLIPILIIVNEDHSQPEMPTRYPRI